MKKITINLILLLLILIGISSCGEVEESNIPVISGLQKDYSLMIGDVFNPLEGVTATSKDGSDVSSNLTWFGFIPVDENNRLTTAGVYNYNIIYLENGQQLIDEEIKLTVINPNQPFDVKPEAEFAAEVMNVDEKILSDGYRIVWADEFEEDGTPNPEYWGYNIGTGSWGWGNGEKQYYTDRSENVIVKDGKLVITAKKERYENCDYTSTRIVSQNKVDFRYGRIDFMAKLPKGKGTWPALWLMPTDSVYGGWPRSGEIDVMEHVGNNQDYVLGTCHSYKYNGGNGKGTTVYRKGVTDTFNLYSLEWTPDKLTFLFNNEAYYTYQNPKYSENNDQFFPYDQEFYIIMNIAMGGTLGGAIDANFVSAEMEVDYVRIYKKDYTEKDTVSPSTAVFSATSTANSIELTWNKVTDNVAFKHYEIFVDGNFVAATNKTHYTITNLEPNTKYNIQVVSVDINGNYSISDMKKVETKQTTSLNNQAVIIKREDYLSC